MKKKIILIISMLLLSICMLAITASASSYFGSGSDISDKMLEYKNDVYFDFYSSEYVHSENSNDADVEIVEHDPFGFFIIKYGTSGEEICGLYNIEAWHAFCVEYNVKGADEMDTMVNSLYEKGYGCNCMEGLFYNFYYYKDELWALYQDYVNANVTIYNEGKADGVNDYKASEEYSSALLSEYTEGFEAYKESTEYKSALSSQYNLGVSTGVKDYIASDEYSQALENEYNNGYETATNEALEKETKNALSAVLGIVGALILGLSGYYFLFANKKRR